MASLSSDTKRRIEILSSLDAHLGHVGKQWLGIWEEREGDKIG